MSRPLPRTSRRAALGGGLAVAIVASGCSPSTSPKGSNGRPSGAGRASSTNERGPEEIDPDAALVAYVLREVSLTHERVRVNRRSYRSLTPRLRRLERLHAQHAAELGGLVDARPGAVSAEGRESLVLDRIRDAEQSLQQRLVRASVDANSGALALLLAAMAAGLAQESTRL